MHAWRWFSAFVVVVLIFTASWYAYAWYTQGERPPFVPLPASAIADPSVDESTVSASDIDSYAVPSSHPRYISIPALGIDKARVQTVGLTSTHVLDMPKNISDTAWYTDSAVPGQGYGEVVIDGHNNGVSRNGVFTHLDNLKDGDEITLTRGDDKMITYKVVENRTESLKDTSSEGMQRLMKPYDTTKEGLGLITDAGNWVPRDKVFAERILVRAVAKD